MPQGTRSFLLLVAMQLLLVASWLLEEVPGATCSFLLLVAMHVVTGSNARSY